MRGLIILALAASMASGQGTVHREKPSDYPLQVRIPGAELGVEYMVRTIAAGGTTFVADDYLVVEIAVFPSKRDEVMVNHHDFTLHLNGKKAGLLTQTPGIVAASLKYPDWNRQTSVVAAAGPVIFGNPNPIGRFPGDRRPIENRVPGPQPRIDTNAGRPEAEEMDVNDLVNRAALPEGRMTLPVSGYIYFPWPGKLSKIKTVDLQIRIRSGEPATLRLR